MDLRPTRKEASPGIFDRALLGGRLAWLKHYARWFNLTVLQQAVWPLMIAVFSAPQVGIEETPAGWYLIRIAGPAVAAILAVMYSASHLRQWLRGEQPEGVLATQLRWALLGLPIAVSAMRLAVGPADEALKIILFGLVNVAAFHLIHFEVVPLAFDDHYQGVQAGAVLFGISWGLHDALLIALSDDGSILLALGAGIVVGWIVAAASLLIRRWPGGALTAAAAHFLVVYLIFGFV